MSDQHLRIDKISTDNGPIQVESVGNEPEKITWFKTDPVTRDFCTNILQLQLVTMSHDQGWVSDAHAGSWSWFEVAIFENAEDEDPMVSEEGEVMSWRSHSNRIGIEEDSLHYGAIFGRRSGLLCNLQAGNVIGVLVCAQFIGWTNEASTGHIMAKFLPETWTLEHVVMPSSDEAPDTTFTLMSTNKCIVKAHDSSIKSQIWFQSPPIDEDVLRRIEDIQLFTHSHDQGYADVEDSARWSWFDVMILENASATEPKVMHGVQLVWTSHTNAINVDAPGSTDYLNCKGKIFGSAHDLVRSLEVGNVIAVRVCAQYPGWENHALIGRLLIRATNIKKHVEPEIAKLDGIIKNNIKAQELVGRAYEEISQTYSELNVEDLDENVPLPSYDDAVNDVLLKAPRADQSFGTEEQPLRLLSLDGGGIRGVSPVRILQQMMDLLGKDAKPCDYFDMICGTSTGGLIAIMLARLEMTCGECLEKYMSLGQRIFTRGALMKVKGAVWDGARFDAKVYEEEIKKLVGEKDPDFGENAKMYEENGKIGKKCKAFVVAVPTKDSMGQGAKRLRTYPPKLSKDSKAVNEIGHDWTIWQAARATSAAPTYFDSLRVGKDVFVDGGLGFNNPALELVREVKTYYGVGREFGCLISLGTGIPPPINLPEFANGRLIGKGGAKDLVPSIIAIATTCEIAHNNMKDLVAYLPISNNDLKYARFNVGPGLNDLEVRKRWTTKMLIPYKEEYTDWEDKKFPDLGDIEKARDVFIPLTEGYLEEEDTKEMVAWCVEKLKKSTLSG